MQEFVNFAREHGLIMNNNLIMDKWVATPTEDHPRSSNGRYKFLGNVGWAINWATMDKPATWFAEGVSKTEIKQRLSLSNDSRKKDAQSAAEKAQWILSQCSLESHPYLERKGFKLEQGNVFVKGLDKLLVIPMRIQGSVVGCQLIDHEGNKKFLHGQTSKGATFTIGARGTAIFCEGYATGLSVRDIMTKMNLPYTIHICFSANNMEFIARNIGKGLIIADNDSSGVGEMVAKKTQKPYWISPASGEDFNDYHMRVGNFKASQDLKRLLLSL